MVSRMLRATWVVVALCLTAHAAPALGLRIQGGPPPDRSNPPPRSEHDRPGLEGARERWQQLTPEQRDEMRRRFDHFQRLSDDERAELRRRFERFGQVQKRAVESLPEGVRRQLESLEGPTRREVLREVATERIAEHGRDALEMMPPPLKERYEAAAPEERERIASEFGRMLHERARDELLRLGRELDLEPARVEEMLRLEPRELGRKVLELKRQAIERSVAERGLPPFVTQEQWNELRQLDGPEFFRRFSALHGRFGPGPGAGAGGPPHDPRLGPPTLGPGERPLDGRGGPPRGEDGGRRFERRAGSDNQQRNDRVRAMRDALRPDPAWFVELSRAQPGERRRLIGERLRERALEWLANAPDLVTPEQLAKLREHSGMRFHDELQKLVPELGPPPFVRDGRGGPPEGERGGPDRPGQGRAGPGRAGQGRDGQGRDGQGRDGQGRNGPGRGAPSNAPDGATKSSPTSNGKSGPKGPNQGRGGERMR